MCCRYRDFHNTEHDNIISFAALESVIWFSHPGWDPHSITCQEMHPVKLDRKIGTKTYHTRLFSSIWIAGPLKHNDSWSSRRVPGKGLILMSCFGTKQQKIDLKRGRFFVVYLAVPTGLGFATRKYLGAQ